MKKVLFFAMFINYSFLITAQESYIVDSTTYELKKEVSGTIDLLWNIIDGKYRYFIKKDTKIVELTNTRNSDKIYQEEYKVTLTKFTSDEELSLENIKLTLPSLSEFANKYNALKNENYIVEAKRSEVGIRLALFGGITNSPFVNNPDNISNPVFGTEVEVFEANNSPSHSIYLQIRQVINSKKFEYSATEFAIGYRFRFIKKPKFTIYSNIELARFSFTKQAKTVLFDDYYDDVTVKYNGFEVPLILGIGAEYKISKNSYITLAYNELCALLLDHQGNFSKSFALGIKSTL